VLCLITDPGHILDTVADAILNVVQGIGIKAARETDEQLG
jgi:hypothetical protein